MKNHTQFKGTPQLIRGIPRRILLMVLDLLLVVAGYLIATMLRFEFDYPVVYYHWSTMMEHLPWMLLTYAVCFWVGGLYEVMWEFAGTRDLVRLASLVCVATGIILIGNEYVHGVLFRTVICIGALLHVCLLGGIRMLWKLIRFNPFTPPAYTPEQMRSSQMPLLIVGAGNAGAWAVKLCKQKKNAGFGNPVVIVDDDEAKHNLRIQGVPVRGSISDVPALVKRYRIREIVIAIPTLKGERLNEVVNLCNSTHCRVRMLSDPQVLDANGNPPQVGFRELNTSDFLSREEIRLDTEQISGYLTDKVVLVTGGGGSIGSELCRQIMRFSPRQLLIFDIYENCAYELECELRFRYGADAPITTLIGSVRDKARLDEVFRQYHPTVVFHAAAHKHVPLMEVSPAEAVKNNVFGTKNLLVAASEHGVDRFVQLSTDKAVNPTNVMGATKRLCEMLIQTFAQNTTMRCTAVRFGNVLGSHGSVIPLFERQIKAGGPVTITHPDIVRYFMTIQEAARLVLQAGGMATSGSIYVLDMGEPVRIMDLAKKLIRFYGYEPGVDIEIRVTGLRPGEKLYEELMMDTEQDKMKKTAHNKIFVAPNLDVDLAAFYDGLQLLGQAAEHNDENVVYLLERMVPTYHPNREMMKDEKEEGRQEQMQKEG